MIKILSAAYHMNIGDRKSARLLKGYIDTINNHESILYGYDGTCLSSREEVEKFCADTDAIIIGAGGIFHNANYNQVFYFTDPELYKYIPCSLIIMATGFNQDYDSVGFSDHQEEILQAELGRADLIGMRTENDRYLAISYGADKSKTFVCPDPLLFIGYNSGIFDKIVASLWVDDWKESIKRNLSGYDFVFINHEDTTFRFSQYAECDFVITNRFHGQLLSFAYNKPCFSIESNIKHRFAREFLYTTNLQHWTEDDSDFLSSFQRFLIDKENMRYYIHGRLVELKNIFGSFLLKIEKVLND